MTPLPTDGSAPAPSTNPTTKRHRRLRVTVRPCMVRDTKMWRCLWYVEGKPKRRFFHTRTEAERYAQSFLVAPEAVDLWATLNPAEQDEILRVVAQVRARGVSLTRVWADWLGRGAEAQTESAKLGDAINELIRAKASAGRCLEYTQTLGYLLGGFARGREAMRIDQVTPRMVNEYLLTKNLRSRPTVRARLSTLFTYAVRHGYMPSDPCARTEKATWTKPPPPILHLHEVEKLLEFFTGPRRRSLAWFVLSTFCGLRPEEAEATTWDMVRKDHIEVKAQTSKKRQRRLVYPHPTGLAWLEFARSIGAELPLSRQTRRYAHRAGAELLGWKQTWVDKEGRQREGFAWKKDVTRHTCASYWLALTNDDRMVASMLGHSVEELHNTYKELVPRDAAQVFWNILPPPIVPFPTEEVATRNVSV